MGLNVSFKDSEPCRWGSGPWPAGCWHMIGYMCHPKSGYWGLRLSGCKRQQCAGAPGGHSLAKGVALTRERNWSGEEGCSGCQMQTKDFTMVVGWRRWGESPSPGTCGKATSVNCSPEKGWLLSEGTATRRRSEAHSPGGRDPAGLPQSWGCSVVQLRMFASMSEESHPTC